MKQRSHGNRSLRRWLIAFVKITALCLTVAWIISSTSKDWGSFAAQEKNWPLLGAAFTLVLSAHLVTYWRWQSLLHALDVPLKLIPAIRLGFLGTLFNMVSVGSVGGDVFKAIEAAHLSHGRRTEVFASILVDRAVGLLGLLIVASIGLVVAGVRTPEMVAIQWASIVLAIVGAAALLGIMIFGKHVPLHWLKKIPVIGMVTYRLGMSCLVFQGQPWLVFKIVTSSMLVHTLTTLGCYIISNALFVSIPPLVDHFAAIPPAMAAATLPITPGGMGVQEMAIAGLFRKLPAVPPEFSAIIMATTFRFVLIGVSLIGVVFYMLGIGKAKAS